MSLSVTIDNPKNFRYKHKKSPPIWEGVSYVYTL